MSNKSHETPAKQAMNSIILDDGIELTMAEIIELRRRAKQLEEEKERAVEELKDEFEQQYIALQAKYGDEANDRAMQVQQQLEDMRGQLDAKYQGDILRLEAEVADLLAQDDKRLIDELRSELRMANISLREVKSSERRLVREAKVLERKVEQLQDSVPAGGQIVRITGLRKLLRDAAKQLQSANNLLQLFLQDTNGEVEPFGLQAEMLRMGYQQLTRYFDLIPALATQPNQPNSVQYLDTSAKWVKEDA